MNSKSKATADAKMAESKTRCLRIVFCLLLVALMPLLTTVYRNEMRQRRDNKFAATAAASGGAGSAQGLLSGGYSTSNNIIVQAKSSSGSCQAFQTENVTTLSLPNQHDLTFFLEGPAFDSHNIEDNAAACRFWRDEYSGHFPHTMQQLYRCISWWYANPTMEPFLVIPKDISSSTNPFLSGFIQALRKAMGVRVVRYRGGLRVVRPIVDYGYNPLPNLGYQTRHPNDLYRMRNVILERYELGRHNKKKNQQYKGGGCPSVDDPKSLTVAMPVIRILNRRPDHGRTLQNIPQLIEALSEQLQVHVTVLDSFEGKSFEEQVEYMASTDILLSPHGAQLTSIPFLPACASVTEFFPVGYYCPEFFASLAAASGGTEYGAHSTSSIAYHSLYTGKDRVNETKTWMKDEQSRTVARLFPVCPNVNIVVEHVRQRIQAWQQCCYTARMESTPSESSRQSVNVLTGP